MKKRGLSIIIVLIMVLSVIPINSLAVNDLTRPVGVNLSGMDTTDIYGTQYTGEIFSEYQLTVLNAWATWCGPCTHEMRYFQMMYNEYEPLGVNVMGMLVEDNMSTVERAVRHFDDNGYTYPSLRIDEDSSAALKRIYARGVDEANTIPMTFLVDSTGTVISAKVNAFQSYGELDSWVRSYYKAPDNTQGQGLGVQAHTQAEIRSFFIEHPAMMDQAVTYSVEPQLEEPYGTGVLSDETFTSALNLLNQLRFIAGLSYNIELDEQKNYYASAATLVNHLNNVMTHYPDRPIQLSDSKYDQLYDDACNGASGSNIGWGYRSLNRCIVNGWMADEDPSNIDRVGHRRWVLNPFMETFGFGVTGVQYAGYVKGESFYRDWNDTYVAWPAQQMPTRYFSEEYPWSVSFGYTVDESGVSVTLVRRSDGKTWNFSNASADGDFYVSTQGYGSPACIIFRPDGIEAYNAGEVFDVTVVVDGDTTLSYSVEFFTLNFTGDINSNDKVDVGDATLLLRYIVGLVDENALDLYSADVNGDGRVNTGDAAYILAYIVGKE